MKYLLDRKIPTIISILVLVFGVIVTTILVQQHVIFFGHAAPSDIPQNIRITNVSDINFTITYTTDASVIGTITLTDGTNKSQVVLDDKDQQSGVPKPYNVHSISARNLTPETQYSFSILSNTTTYLDGDKPFSLITVGKITDTPSSQIPLAGKVLLPNGQVPSETLIFITSANGQLLSTLLNPSGLYILPLNTMRIKDLTKPFSFNHDSIIQILATNGQLTSHASVSISGINPIPVIVLGQDYDFTLSTKPIASSSAETSFPTFEISNNNTYKATPQIITPKENESFSDSQPEFQGTASPNSSVTISIHSDAVISTQVTTDSSGNWSYRPTTALSPGKHTITITAPDQFGILHTIEQSFTVYAAGTQVNESATPSATLAPTKIPTPTPTKFPTVTPTPRSQTTLIPLPTATPTSSTTKGGLPITPKPSLPPTGSNTVALAGAIGVATAAIGIVLFLIAGGIGF